MKNRIIATVMFIIAAVLMFLAANQPQPQLIAPKTKAPFQPCPPNCVIEVTQVQGALVLRPLPKPILLASPATRPYKPCPPHCAMVATAK